MSFYERVCSMSGESLHRVIEQRCAQEERQTPRRSHVQIGAESQHGNRNAARTVSKTIEANHGTERMSQLQETPCHNIG